MSRIMLALACCWPILTTCFRASCYHLSTWILDLKWTVYLSKPYQISWSRAPRRRMNDQRERFPHRKRFQNFFWSSNFHSLLLVLMITKVYCWVECAVETPMTRFLISRGNIKTAMADVSSVTIRCCAQSSCLSEFERGCEGTLFKIDSLVQFHQLSIWRKVRIYKRNEPVHHRLWARSMIHFFVLLFITVRKILAMNLVRLLRALELNQGSYCVWLFSQMKF